MATSTDDFSCRRDRTAAVSGAFAAAGYRHMHKAHVGVDKDSGIVHMIKVTAANQHDVSMTSELLTGEENVVYGDCGYLGAEKREDAVKKNANGKRIRYKINRRPSQIAKKTTARCDRPLFEICALCREH